MEHSLYVDEGRMEPLNLGVLGGLCPDDIDVRMYDDRMEDIPYDEESDLIVITVETYTARRSYEISKEYRKRGKKVIMGGMHPTLLAKECEEYADALCFGDAESVWLEILDDASKGQLKKVYQGNNSEPQLETLPRRELYKGKGYLPISLIQYGRGCHFACEFCAISTYFDRRHRYRRIDRVIKEIENQNRRTLFFVDDNLISDHQSAKELFEALIPMKVRWVSQGSLDMLNDRKMMELMVKSGCLGNVIGFESINYNNLKKMRKASNIKAQKNEYQEAVQRLRDYGLQTWAAFTFGHDDDNVDSIRRTVDFAIESKFCFAAFNILVPYPSTPLYHRLQKEERLLWRGKWWLHENYRFNWATFMPKLMSPETLTECCFEARSRFNSMPNMIRRFFDIKTHMSSPTRMGVYWGYNPLFRKETFKKHGMKFGLYDHGKTELQTMSTQVI